MGPRRFRGRPPGRRGSGPNQVFDSNGPGGMKVRGNARQVADRYQALARDALSSGDRVSAEGFLQYAEHYQRMQAALAAGAPKGPPRAEGRPYGRGNGRADDRIPDGPAPGPEDEDPSPHRRH